jgi:hypothetical protein
MTQTYEKVMEMKSPKIEQAETPEEILGDLNPRYFEEDMTLENALEKVHSSAMNFSAKYNAFRPF